MGDEILKLENKIGFTDLLYIVCNIGYMAQKCTL